MAANPTPGEVAYAAYCRVVYGVHAQAGDYADLTWGQHDAWDAVAQAVIAAWWRAHAQGSCGEERRDA